MHDLTDEWTYNEHLEDVNRDRHVDLKLHFNTQDTGIACGDTEAVLAGQRVDGMWFEGTDAFETVGCGTPDKKELPALSGEELPLVEGTASVE